MDEPYIIFDDSEYEDELEREDEWDYVTEVLQELMDTIASKSPFDWEYPYTWEINAYNMGWRDTSGRLVKNIETATGLLQAILPRGQPCRWHVYEEELWLRDTWSAYGVEGPDRFRFCVWHHDSPVRPDVFEVRQMTSEEVEGYELEHGTISQ